MSPPHLTDPALRVAHGFFTREGGVSTGPYASLNGSTSSDDDAAHVAANRALVLETINPGGVLLGCHQVHGVAVAVVVRPWAAGEGPRADAMVTARPDATLVVITADCAPVLFADAARGIVGAAHAGWRGAVAGVLEATVAAMLSLGADDIRACVGPCIGQDSYEVGADVADNVDTRFLRAGTPGHWWFDLAGYCASRLSVPVAHARADTLADQRFWSHRRRTLAGGGAIGHQMSAICNRVSV